MPYEGECDWEPDDRYDDDRDDGRNHVSGFCSACGEECTSVTIDEGIGAYEYWGAPGNDVQLVEVSPCCEAEVEEEE